MRQSMDRADNCYDATFMESCFGTIKRELEMERYAPEAIALKEISGYIRYYSTRCRYSALGYLTPEELDDIMRAPGRRPTAAKISLKPRVRGGESTGTQTGDRLQRLARCH
jgi:hypothetical protein